MNLDRPHLEKILVIALPGIGDLLLLTPALRVLRREFPRADIDPESRLMVKSARFGRLGGGPT